MNVINITELRQHLATYLKQVWAGQEIAITLHGKTIVRIVPDKSVPLREAATRRLAALRGMMITGDVLASSDSEWTGMETHPPSRATVCTRLSVIPAKAGNQER